MLYEAIIIGVIAGWINGGTLKNLAYLGLKKVSLVFLAFAIKLGLEFWGAKGVDFVFEWRLLFQTVLYLLLFWFLWFNRDLPGVKLLGAGFFLNFLVIALNGGAMPTTISGIDPEYVELVQSGKIATYSIITESTRLPWLADVMVQPWPKAKAFSLGDILISAGIFWLVFRAMKGLLTSTKLTSVREMELKS